MPVSTMKIKMSVCQRGVFLTNSRMFFCGSMEFENTCIHLKTALAFYSVYFKSFMYYYFKDKHCLNIKILSRINIIICHLFLTRKKLRKKKPGP